jgi:hypothetical protein
MGAITCTHLSGGYSNGVLQISLASNAVMTNIVTIDGNTKVVSMANAMKTTPIPFAQLPSVVTSVGCIACINDSPSTTPGTLVTTGGGGSFACLFCTTAGWKVVMG